MRLKHYGTKCMLLLLTLHLSILVNAQYQKPGEIARRIANRVVGEAHLKLSTKAEAFKQQGIYVFDLTHENQGSFTIHSRLSYSQTSSMGPYFVKPHLAIHAYAGAIAVYLNDQKVLQAVFEESKPLKMVDYSTAKYSKMVPISLKPEMDLRIEFTPRGPNRKIYLGITNKTGISWPGVKLSFNDLIDYYYDGVKGAKIIPSKRVITDHHSPLDINDWRYFSGTLLDALWHLGEQFPDLNYEDYIQENLDFYTKNIQELEKERSKTGSIEGAFSHYFRYELLDDFGMQTVPFVRQLDSDEPNSTAIQLVQKALDKIMRSSQRLEDGTYARLNPTPNAVWADDLFMGNVILIRASQHFENPKFLEEAIFQTRQMDKYLRDPTSGLYWHGYFHDERRTSPSKWGRANGWTMMAKTELLLSMDKDHEDYDEMIGLFKQHLDALLVVQSDDGRWHQVLDNTDTYLETSCTAMFIRALAEGLDNGWIKGKVYKEALLKGWTALTRQVDQDGNVVGIVKGTPILFSDLEYQNQKTRINDPRGLGALLYACAAIDKLKIINE